ncbi:isopentenyl-diphosphate Delta-isomerase [Candidatus Saccharibacteria bacterium]|nr:isopentenyl-diphosphate Delta-isomerase [Candidatus Saccharibacteria bacterium]
MNGDKKSVELIVYVDENGVPTGETAPKLEAHNSSTRLHAAFSCYIFDDKGRILVTRRALGKKVWPGVWTNSVCGHPGPDESHESAIARRADYELGMKIKDLSVMLPDYVYKTTPFNGIVEYEFCPVYLARMSSDPNPNAEEVEAYKWIEWDEFVAHLADDDGGNHWSFWCKDQVRRFRPEILKSYLNPRT